jgi:hypothetical protein
MVHLVYASTALAFITNMGDKHVSTSPTAIQSVKEINIEEKLDVLGRLANGEQSADTCHNVGLPHTSVCKICNNADRIKGIANGLDNKKCQQSELRSICLCNMTTTFQLE